MKVLNPQTSPWTGWARPAANGCGITPPGGQRVALLAVFGAMLSLAFSALGGSSPFLIPYQGRLTNPQGVPYTNGQYTLAFNLYDQPVGGSNLWSETHYKVGVINGMVNVFLGSINSLSGVDFSQSRHLGITIYADNNPNNPAPEMVPRQMIIPAFWAKNSEKLAGYDWTPLFGANNPTLPLPGGKIQTHTISTGQLADSAVTAAQIAPGAVVSSIANGTVQGQQIATGGLTVTNFGTQLVLDAIIPPGTISAFGGANVPAGWLLCDGRTVSSSQYPRLFSAIATNWGVGSSGGIAGTNDFNLPDLRGLFLRGVNGARTNSFNPSKAQMDPDVGSRTNFLGGASGNAVGSLQGAIVGSHIHSIIGNGGSGSAAQLVSGTIGGENAPYIGRTTGYSPDGSIGNETRPVNAYVNFIIKF